MSDIEREIAKLQEKIQRIHERRGDAIDDESHLQMLLVQRAAMQNRVTVVVESSTPPIPIAETLGTLKDVVREQHDGPREYTRAGLGFFF